MTSRQTELLLRLSRQAPTTLRAQIESQLRAAIRVGSLRPGTALPSTRELARQCGVSRPVVMEAYAQLAAEGFLTLRQGALARVATLTASRVRALSASPREAPALRYDFRPGVPDLGSFPKRAWLRATQTALSKMSSADFGYEQAHGAPVLRAALAEYLGRVRGVIADPAQVVVTGGFEQGRSLLARALRSIGAQRLVVEDPGYADWQSFIDLGFELLPVPVDDEGLRTDALPVSADVVSLTPTHQFPTGVEMSGARRREVIAWLRARAATAIEDDYDAEFRYDRAPIGALQSLDPDRIVYAGSASKTLSPALRLGWLVVPVRLQGAVQRAQRLQGHGCPRIDQHALAELLASGEFDRHLRRMRAVYRSRREALLQALCEHLPGIEVGGIDAGLHATVRLPRRCEETRLREAARRRGVTFEFLSRHRIGGDREGTRTTLLLGYTRGSESSIRLGIRALAMAIEAC